MSWARTWRRFSHSYNEILLNEDSINAILLIDAKNAFKQLDRTRRITTSPSSDFHTQTI